MFTSSSALILSSLCGIVITAKLSHIAIFKAIEIIKKSKNV